MSDRLRRSLEQHETVVRELGPLLPAIEALGRAVRMSLASGGRVIVFGNGGSAAEAQHLAAELLGRARRERAGLPAIALTGDSSTVTAIANDYGFAEVFARQVSALASRRDVVLGISTSGRSENVLRGLAAARGAHATTALLTGAEGTRSAVLVDHAVVVPSADTSRVQEMHLVIVHLICEIVDEWAIDERGAPAQG
jgi:D-sedoheptulose 7-phosphate isomerase